MSSSVRDLRLSLIQTDIQELAPAQNRAHFEELIEDLAGQAELVLLPEMFTTGFSMDVSAAEAFKTDTVRWMQMLSDRLSLCIVGSVMTKERNRYFNRCLVTRPGQPLLWYDKRHLFRPGGETDIYTAGKERLIFDYLGWRICPLICYDLRFPVFSRNVGPAYDLLLYTASWPAHRALAWNTLLPARAVENQAYCAGVSRIGALSDGTQHQGDSQVLRYDGISLLNLAAENKSGRITLSHQNLVDFRTSFPAWQDADAFELR